MQDATVVDVASIDGRMMPWADRLALIDRLQPTPFQMASAFGVTIEEVSVARDLVQDGTLCITVSPVVSAIDNNFFSRWDSVAPRRAALPQSSRDPDQETIPEFEIIEPPPPERDASGNIIKPKRKKDGGSKIAAALVSVPLIPTPVEAFAKRHGVSIPVLRQSNRFLPMLSESDRATIGGIFVRQDPATKTLMIWKELPKAKDGGA